MTKISILLLVLFAYQASTMDIDQYFFPRTLGGITSNGITTRQITTSDTPNIALSSLTSSIIGSNLQTTTTTSIKQNTTNTSTNSSSSQPSVINTGGLGGLTTAGFLATCLSRIVEQAIFKMPQLVKLAQSGFISLENQKIDDTSYIITYDGANFDAMVKGRCIESSKQVVIQLVRYNEY